ncbi:MAG: flagellar basal body P-ring formation chaperone FlgA [Paracoccus sp. (in: a-proteobacteria)]|jgi:flagella basal body P-ring formation protein FlgA|uniref:flagellar basal body P-ring formation chaperone FlgA n=1 Tax=unclassified Paracoccus (in: a-proteobacteria) TaxID=2688777 RepID=UPI000C46F45C|nr:MULTISPECIES: flagellar basal body P-ring formation chaperone FlgA [unclassified Paracoccus (in: a-proteobacteria)]MAN55692.1 flagella basal body P-ring formation protein FlgA [Paracoccus sp. (in: a-proteobacteria)]MBA47792.1 flagella basal body P-ring formation protein FlgA [Paracoccus sp. (in: a-proteobacteria)]|tara:strand:- start:952 stop:1368 length:417 start_codon:yes stop_codon:yes gene_type:complete
MRALATIAALLVALPASAGGLAAARTLPAGTIITAADLRAIDSKRPGLDDPSQAIGLQTRITIYEGRPIQATLLQAPKLVGRNQIVRLSFRRGALRIDAQGRTLSDGAAGDVIRVMNLDSRSIINALVEEDGSLTTLN